MSYRIDLHTHSVGSADGGLTVDDYRRILERGTLDYIAITDHNSIEMAEEIKKQLGKKWGERIIIGEEIMTRNGEIIGLYLGEPIPPRLLHTETVRAIKKQGGLVYIPHPFETVRKGMSEAALMDIISDVDIIEGHNGRAIVQNRGSLARVVAAEHDIPVASSSDAHGRRGWGRTYSSIEQAPLPSTLVGLLVTASHRRRTVRTGVVYPKLNRLAKRLRKP